MAKVNFRAPRYNGLPHVCTMLDSIGSDQAVADFLGLSRRSIQKYRSSGQAPKPVMYALFWETPWGASCADVGASNDAARAWSKANSLDRQNAELKRKIELLEAELSGYQTAANSAFFLKA